MVGDLDPWYDKPGVGGGGGLIMVGGLVPRYDSGSEGRCTQYERRGGGGGSCLAEEGEVPYMKGQLYD